MAELFVPDRVTDALAAAVGMRRTDPLLNELSHRLFAPVVAAELRRVASDGVGWAIRSHLLARADELDAGGEPA